MIFTENFVVVTPVTDTANVSSMDPVG